MPASSFSSALDTGVYLLATGLFLALTVPILNQVYRSSEAEALHSITDGLRLEVDSLVPGMKTKFVYYSPQSPMTISLRHTAVVASIDNLVLVENVRWNLPETKLVPGTDYTLSLVGNGVFVEESRRN